MIKVSQSAANKINDLIAEKNDSSIKYFRLSVVGGGCTGFQYSFAFDIAANEDDFVIEESNARVLVDSISMNYVKEATLDYIEQQFESRFAVVNPNVTTTCGCGSSFAV